MKKDTEIRLYLQERKKGMTQRVAAARAGIAERTARRYERAGALPSQLKGPHDWKTRIDPFEQDWPWVVSELERDCLQCPCRSLCTSAPSNPRQLTLRRQAQYEALQATRLRKTTQEFKTRYAIRAGIEGTLSQGVRAFDLRRSRYIGQQKTHLQHVIIAIAINFSRILRWIMGIPLDTTRVSRFAALSP